VPGPGKKTSDPADEWLLDPADPAKSEGPEPDSGPAESFLPTETETKPTSAPDGTIGAETAQWIVPDAPAANGTKAHEVPPPTPIKTEPVEPAPPKPARAKPGRAAPTKKLKQLKEELAEQKAENRDLAKRLREAQTELSSQSKRSAAELAKVAKERDQLQASLEKREGELMGRIEKLESTLADAKAETERSRKEAAARTEPAPRSTRSTSRTQKAGGRRKTSARKGAIDVNGATFEELRGLGLSVTQSARMIAYRDVRKGFESLDEIDEIPGLPKETRTELRKKLTLSS
jgi:DNA uptake protein ComE-like DNA-binding protein